MVVTPTTFCSTCCPLLSLRSVSAVAAGFGEYGFSPGTPTRAPPRASQRQRVDAGAVSIVVPQCIHKKPPQPANLWAMGRLLQLDRSRPRCNKRFTVLTVLLAAVYVGRPPPTPSLPRARRLASVGETGWFGRAMAVRFAHPVPPLHHYG